MHLFELILVFMTMVLCSGLMFYFIRNHANPKFQKLYKDDDDLEIEDDFLDARPSNNYKDFLANKWLAFGGGFYGLVAVLTYIIVEAQEIIDLFDMPGEGDVFSGISIGMLINFFIDSLMNFITAISWPVFWMNTGNAPFWKWFLAAYIGYLVGKTLVKTYYPLKRS
ncbi:MAG: hypothetical protein OQK49_02345 [Proteobacteria bacterium]|nr:hypothetical protein [Pseudomonadota bacterium]